MQHQLIPEWEPSEAVILAWPTVNTDWANWLDGAQTTYINIIQAINDAGACVILLCAKQEIPSVKTLLPSSSKVLIVAANYDDTWVRDYAFLTCECSKGRVPIEFIFNGWGAKFDANKDDRMNKSTLATLCRNPLQSYDLVTEGGSLEIDENGTLLTTSLCLMNPKRNGNLTLEHYKRFYAKALGNKRFICFENGHLEGDDTDAHIDTLVRFTPNKGLVIQTAFNRPHDSHFKGLEALVNECRHALPDHSLFLLPLAHIETKTGERLPASYANFLICNKHVLVPTYNTAEDASALDIIRSAYPSHHVIGIDCSVLINQFGSLHCITMQVPNNTLRIDVMQQAQSGVSTYAP